MAIGGIIPAVIAIVVLWYSLTMWRSLDEYFRDEFKKSLVNKNYKTNQQWKEKRINPLDEDNKIISLTKSATQQTQQEPCNSEHTISDNCRHHENPTENKYLPPKNEEPDTCPLEFINDEQDTGGKMINNCN